MRHAAWIPGIAVLVIALHLRAQTPAPQPIFRGGTDLVQVDVSVLDNKRHAVRGLTAADFTVFEDGKPREIQAFSEVYLPDRVRADAAAWVREVPSDVASNQTVEADGRLVIILIDRSIAVGEPTLRAKRIATAAVNALGPDDLGAVVSTSNGMTQNLTSDRGRLVRAINQGDLSTKSSPEALEIMNRYMFKLTDLNDGRCLCGLCVLETITRVADAVQSTPRRRKVLLFIGSSLIVQAGGVGVAPSTDPGCESRLTDARNAMFEAVDRANLTVHALDPNGLTNIGPVNQTSSTLRIREVPLAMSQAMNEFLQKQGSLRVLPDRTGGRAVMNTNAPDLQVGDIFRETESYYLIGFRPSDPSSSGMFHAIQVKTGRRGVDIHSRSGYYAATPPAPAASATAAPAASSRATLSAPLRAAIGGVLPDANVSVDVNTATFATPGSSKAAVVMAVGVGGFAAASSDPGAGRRVPLQVVTSAFDRGGRPVGIATQTLELSWPAVLPAHPRADVLSRLDLPPGEYEIRIGVTGAEPPRTASVFSYVTVPSYQAAPLSLSSVVLGATVGTVTAPKDFLAGTLPIVPTARREFASTDRLVAFLRVYQGTRRSDALLPVLLRASVLDAGGRAVAGEATTLDASQFAKGRAADHYLGLPLAGLGPGEYLLRIEAEMGQRIAGRAVRFSVR
jgi:VWFA-related protein